MIRQFFADKKLVIFILIAFILFFIPFFWLRLGEMDLGGDSNRLYFYDPLSNLTAFSIYSVVPWGVGNLSYNQYFLPFLLFLTILKFFFNSPTILIAIFNGFKLSGSFIFTFLIIKEFLFKENKKRISVGEFAAAIIGALFYTFSPSVIDNMKYALVTHNQVFLNPMIFYLILRYLITSSLRYLWIMLLVTFIFSTNFSLQAPPPLFAFYPLAIAFLLLYNFFVLQKPIPWKGILFGIVFFVGLHAFHLLPAASNVFDKDSYFNNRVFESNSKVNGGLDYFMGTLSAGKVSEHFFLPLENKKIMWSLIIIPALTVGGFLFLRKNKTVLLISIFFFITLFLVSANITHIGVAFYRKLFSIPGFGMFRVFYGQWQWVYTFFYTLLIATAISYLFSRMKEKYIFIISIVTIGFLIARSWIVINGDIVNVVHRASKDVSVVIHMDPHYEKMLEFIKKIPNDGRILHMPFTDYAYNIVGGVNRGVYIGHSMPAFLAGRNDFSGYQNIDPFSESYVKLVKEKNYSAIKQMMSLLQIRYIIYNADEKVSNKFFPAFPYGYTGTPFSEPALGNFVKKISGEKVYQTGTYSLIEVEHYLPHFYAASNVSFYDTNPKYDKEYSKALSFFPNSYKDDKDKRIAFVDRAACKKILSTHTCNNDTFQEDNKDLQITYQRINPTKYNLEIKNVTKPFLLIFQDSFNSYWKLYPTNASLKIENKSDSYYDGKIIELVPANQFIDKNPFETNGKESVYDNTHIQVNGYANAWYIKPEDLSRKNSITVIVEMTAQKKFYYSLGITIITLLIFLLYGIKLLKR